MACTQSDYSGALKFDTDKLFVFDRPFNSVDDGDIKNQSVNESISGVIETLNFYDRYSIPITRNWITGTEYTGLRRWYDYARDGSSFEFWKDYKLVSYWPFSDGVDSSDGTVSGIEAVFNRSGSTATLLNPDTGLIESTVEDEPRLVAGPFDYSRAILIERESTNLLTYSNDLSNAAWTKSGCTIQSDAYYSPDGTKNLDVIEADVAGVNGYVSETISGTFTTPHALSFYGRSQGEGYDVTFSCPELSESVECTLTNELQRFFLYVNPVLESTLTIKVTSGTQKGSAVGFFQFEEGLYSTSYMSTLGTTVTRNEETLTCDVNENINPSNFSLSSWIYHVFDGDSKNYIFFTCENGSDTYIKIYKTTLPSLQIDIYDEFGDQAYYATDTSFNFTTGWHYYTFTFDSDNETVKIFLDGTEEYEKTTYYGRVPAFDTLRFNPTESLHYKSVMKFHGTIIENRVISISEHAARYNQMRDLGIGKNYFPDVRLTNPTFNPIRVLGGNRWNFDATLEEVL